MSWARFCGMFRFSWGKGVYQRCRVELFVMVDVCHHGSGQPQVAAGHSSRGLGKAEGGL